MIRKERGGIYIIKSLASVFTTLIMLILLIKDSIIKTALLIKKRNFQNILLFRNGIDKKIIIGFLILLSMINIVLAIPDTMTLQGKLTNDGGSPLQGTYNMSFKIYDDYTSGNVLWQLEDHDVSTDANGVYDVMFKDVNLNFSDEYYLGITVGTDDEGTPRINLSSSPYAFRANVSEDLNPENEYKVSVFNITGNLSIGTSSDDVLEITTGRFNVSDGDLELGGNLSLSDKITFSLGSIMDNIVSGFLRISSGLNVTGNLTVGANTLFVDNTSGYVGIGTRLPQQKLVVIGTVNITAGLNVTGGMRVSELASCDTIDTDAAGNFKCGSDDSTGGGSAWGLANYSEAYSDSGFDNENFTVRYDARADRFGVSNGTALAVGGEVSGTVASITLDNDALDDQYVRLGANFDNENFTTRYNLRTDRWQKANSTSAFLTQLGLNITRGDLITPNNTTWAIKTVNDSIKDYYNHSIDLGGYYNTEAQLTALLDNDYVDVDESPTAADIAGSFSAGLTIGGNKVQLAELDVSDVSDDIAGDIAEGELADNIIVSADIKDGEVGAGDIGVDAVSDSELDGGFSWTLDADLNINSNTLVIDQSDSEVGIGTASPNEKLVVIGNVNISGTLNVSGRVAFPNLANCDTIDTDARGVLSCGSDDSTSGGSVWDLVNNDTSAFLTQLGLNITRGDLITPNNTTWAGEFGNVTTNSQIANTAGYVTSSGVTAVTGAAPITSTGGTTPEIGLTLAKDIVAGTGLSGGENNVLPGAEADTTLSVDFSVTQRESTAMKYGNITAKWSNLDLDSTNDVESGDSAGGDLTGTYPNPTIGTGKVQDDEMDYTDVTLSDFTNDVGFQIGGDVNSTSWNRTGTNVILAMQGDNVGIGTTEPSSTLEVSGNMTVAETNNTMGNFSIIQYNASCAGFRFGGSGGLILSCE